jgi:hypothetical protein
MKRMSKIAAFCAAATFIGHWLWPLFMFPAHYIFTKPVS